MPRAAAPPDTAWLARCMLTTSSMRTSFVLALLTTASAAPAQPTKPPPYSMPWQLRPAVAATVVRSDTAVALYEAPTGELGTTIASMLLASYKLTAEFAPLVRLAVVQNSPPLGDGAFALANPALGATYALKPAQDLRLALFLGVTVPVGMGGGNWPDLAQAAAMASAIPASPRSSDASGDCA